MIERHTTGRNGDEIVFHFDVERHSIPLKQFIDTARSTQMVIDDFNEQLFDNKLRYELRVRSPETGGLMEVLGLVILGGGGAMWAFLATDIGKAFIKGLTGEEPAYWAEYFGKKTRDGIEKRKSKKKELSKEVAMPEAKEIDARLLVEMIISFLAANVDKLEQVGITPAKFQRSFSGRNAIYKACIDNPEVKGLSFDRTHDFPIKRADFPRQITHIPEVIEPEAAQQIAWSVESVDIIVNSPNWKRDGRKWQAATNKFQDIAFSIEDETFWHHVDIKDIKPDIRDNMRVQWAYPAGLSKPASVRVLKVLTYNGKDISQPLSESELKRILEEPYIIEPDAPDLFSNEEKHRKLDENGGH
jgi:hypothetical protein